MKGSSRAKMITLTGMLAALYAIVSQFSVPFIAGIPITFQCFIIALGAYVFGAGIGIMSTITFIAAGAAGLPVFALFKGGVQALAGATGGFIWGFIPLAFVCGLVKNQSRAAAVTAGCVAALLCHAAGVTQFAFVTYTGINEAFWLVSAPYLIKDLCLTAAAQALSDPIKRKIGHLAI